MGSDKLNNGVNMNDFICVDTNQLEQQKIIGNGSIYTNTLSSPDMNIDGDLSIGGKLIVDNIDVVKSRIVLNLDLKHIEEVLDKMDSDDLKYFLKHLHKLKLLTEKKLFERI
jgi:hypothetical protein